MTDHTELKRLATRIVEVQTSQDVPISKLFDDFEAAACPETILALIAENECQATQFKKWQASHHANYCQVAEERDQLKADNEALRREREGKVLCDLELFETLRDAANTEAGEHRQCMATYRPLRQASLDSVVKKCDDLLAAMGKGQQS